MTTSTQKINLNNCTHEQLFRAIFWKPKVSLVRLSVKKSRTTIAQNTKCWGPAMLSSDFSVHLL